MKKMIAIGIAVCAFFLSSLLLMSGINYNLANGGAGWSHSGSDDIAGLVKNYSVTVDGPTGNITSYSVSCVYYPPAVCFLRGSSSIFIGTTTSVGDAYEKASGYLD